MVLSMQKYQIYKLIILTTKAYNLYYLKELYLTSTKQLLDGWRTDHGSSGNLDTTVTQSTDAPAGFSKSLKITPDSTLTPSASQNGLLSQYLEGQDFQDLAFGTSDAKPVTVSWYAKTSATGAGNYTVKVEYNNGTNNYAVNKLFAFTRTFISRSKGNGMFSHLTF